MCKEGFRWFCAMSHYNWAALTLGMFLVSLPLILIQDLRKFKWVNIAALLSLSVMIVVALFILLFKDLTDYESIYDPNVRIFETSSNR